MSNTAVAVTPNALRVLNANPDCLTALEFSEGASLCRACGFSSAA